MFGDIRGFTTGFFYERKPMLSLEEFNSMPYVERSNYLRDNFKPTKRSISCRRRTLGVGINDSDYMTTAIIGGAKVKCPAYTAWSGVMIRAYGRRLKERYGTYANVECCQEWNSFMSFREWWVSHCVDGWQVDKDILSTSSKIYSPQTCLFVPCWLNNFTIDSGASRGMYKIGLHRNKRSGSYVAQCNYPGKGLEYLGCFSSEDDAHFAWKKRKLEIALEMKPKMDEIDVRIYDGVVRIICEAR